jgi:hypothetical protein
MMRGAIAATILIAAAGPAAALAEIAQPSPMCSVQGAYPDPSEDCTPGSENEKVKNTPLDFTICGGRRFSGRNPDWTSEQRPPTRATNILKKALMRSYGLEGRPLDAYELDHLIPLQLGGAPSDPHNLWPQAYDLQPGAHEPGAHEKDSVETWLKIQVCKKVMTLAQAQTAVKECWLPIWQRVYQPRHPEISSPPTDLGAGGVSCAWLGPYTSAGA